MQRGKRRRAVHHHDSLAFGEQGGKMAAVDDEDTQWYTHQAEQQPLAHVGVVVCVHTKQHRQVIPSESRLPNAAWECLE